MEELKCVSQFLVERLGQDNLNCNPKKSELISDNLDDNIELDGSVLIAKRETKYLGQFIDSKGKSRVILKESAFGKLYSFLNSTSDLSKLAQIRLISIYSKSKIMHLLQLICVGEREHIEETWKMIRKVFFRTVLKRDTNPKECMCFYKLGFYEIMVRPMVKIMLSVLYSGKPDERATIQTALTKCMEVWITYEQNLLQDLRTYVTELIHNPRLMPDLARFDELRLEDGWFRIVRGASGSSFKRMYILPTVILWASNAKMHEVEERLARAAKASDQRLANIEMEECGKIISRYCMAVEYCHLYSSQSERILSKDWSQAYSDLLMDAVAISDRTNSLPF